MKETDYSPRLRIKFQYLLIKWEGVITAIVTLCAILAILSGIVWLIVRKNNLLILLLGLSSCYLIGKTFWKFRDERIVPAWKIKDISFSQEAVESSECDKDIAPA